MHFDFRTRAVALLVFVACASTVAQAAMPAVGTDTPQDTAAASQAAPAASTTPHRHRRHATPVAKTETAAPAAEAPSTPAVAQPVAPSALALRGKVSLTAGPRQTVVDGEVADALVYFLPKSGAPTPKPGKFSVSTQSKGFSPNLLVVPVGSTVAFPNTDTILHNVYSRTPGSTFDLGTYGPGQVGKTVLNQPGLVLVNCNVHHNMRANIVVLATPYYTRPAKDGSFSLDGLPPGPGTLVFWHPRSNAVTQQVSAGAAAVVQPLVATKPRLDARMLMGN